MNPPSNPFHVNEQSKKRLDPEQRRLTSAMALTLAGFLAISLLHVGLASRTAHADSRKSESALMTGLKAGRYVALIRHALAPGTGDPGRFRLGDCSTQRNLSNTGREQARRIGAKMMSYGITEAAVYTSQWCRCRETARLLSVGAVRDLPPLNSFFRDMSRSAAQTRSLRAWLKDRLRAKNASKPLILVTHFVNIQSLTGYAPASGEVVLIQVSPNGAVSVAGTVRTR